MQENQDLIGYDEIIENSMRSVIYETLKKVENKGLPGGHYFIISFSTNHPEVKIADSLKEKYQNEMTIVMQYQYKNLEVEKDHFNISLSFAGNYEKLSIPYKSVTSFADPSMNFGLKFSISQQDLESDDISDTDLEEANDDSEEKQEKNKKPSAKTKATSKSKAKKKKSKIDTSKKVVSLDEFRKEKNNDNETE